MRYIIYPMWMYRFNLLGCHEQTKKMSPREGGRFLGSSLLSGGLLVLAGPPFNCWPLVFVAWIPVLMGLKRAWHHSTLTWGWAFACGFYAGLPLYGSLWGWITHHHVSYWFVATLTMSIPFGLATKGILLGLRLGLRDGPLVLWIVCLWTSMEIVMALCLKIPSCAMGYGLWKIPILIQNADLGGVFGISFWIMSVNSLCVLSWRRRRQTYFTVLLVLILSVFHLSYGVWSWEQTDADIHAAPHLQTALVQSSVATSQKYDRPILLATLQDLCQQTTRIAKATSAPLDLVVWPETSIPAYLGADDEQALRMSLESCARQIEVPFLFGALTKTERNHATKTAVYNSAYLTTARGVIDQAYHKQVLVPFYEAVPSLEWFPERWQAAYPRPLIAGKQPGVMTLDPHGTLGVLICWEILLPQVVNRVAKQASCLVNITNDDAIFGTRKSFYQLFLPHLIFRAIESRRSLLRCANRGYTLAINPKGQITTTLPWGQLAAEHVPIALGQKQTLYTRFGFGIAWGCVGITAVWGLVMLWRLKS